MNKLQGQVEGAEEEIEQERLKRKTTELNLNRDLEEVERSCNLELKRASSAYSLDTQHLKQVCTVFRIQETPD